MSVSAIPGLLPDEANRSSFLGLVQALRNRRALALVGAGASRRIGYPLWNGLAASLESEILRMHPEKRTRIEALTRLKDQMFRIGKLKAELGMDAFIPWVRATFGPKSPAFDSFHEELVALPFRHVLTTNYDPVLAEAHNGLWKSGKSELVRAAAQVVDWSNLDDVRELFESLHDAKYSRRYVHLHGRYNAHNTLILTNDEYQARYRDDVRNRRLLEGLFGNFRIVTLGFGFADVELLRIFEDLKQALGPGRPLHFGLLALGDPSEPRDAAVEREQLREQYGIEPVFYPWTADHGELATLVHSLLTRSIDAPTESVAAVRGRKSKSAKPTLPAVLPLLLTEMDDSRPASARMTELLALANVTLELGLSREQIHAKFGPEYHDRTGIAQSKPGRYCEVGLTAPPLEVTKFQAWVESEAKVFIDVTLRKPAQRCTLFCGQPIKKTSVELPLLGRAKKQATIRILGLEWVSEVLRGKHPELLARYSPEEGRQQIDGYSGTSFERLQQDYFQGIHNRFWELSTLGMPTHARRSKGAWNPAKLASLFVPLRFRPVDTAREPAGDGGDARLASLQDGSTTLAEILKVGRSAVLLGDPGTGKTTILRFLALLFAGHAGLDGYQPTVHLVPIFVPLREFVRRHSERSKAGHFDFLDFAVEQARAQEQPDMHRVYFVSALLLGRAVLLLDGLDEVGSEEARQDLRTCLVSFLQRWPLACCLVTSRIFGYEQARLPVERFVELRVEPLSESESQQFVKRWYELRGPTGTAQQAELTESLRQAIGRTPSVRHLASNPLLLTLMAMIHQSEGKLPQYRGELYEYCVKMLLETWPAARRGQASPASSSTVVERLKLDLHPQQSILSRLALYMQEQTSQHDAVGRGLIRRADAIRVLGSAYLERVKHEQPGLRQHEADARMADYIDYLEEHTGLLIDRGDHLLAFVHLSFQEYLAAWSYRATGAPAHSLPAERLLDPAWQEVVLLRLYLLRHKEEPMLLSTALEAVFGRLRSAPDPAGWLTLTRAIRDELIASPDDRRLVLRRIIEHWASLGTWDEQFWPAIEEVWLFSEQGRASLREILSELGQVDDSWLVIAAVNLGARLNMPLPDLLRQLATRRDISQIADELLLLRTHLDVRDFAERYATATGHARLFATVEGPEALTCTPSLWEAAEDSAACRGAVVWLFQKILAEWAVRARFATPERAAVHPTLFDSGLRWGTQSSLFTLQSPLVFARRGGSVTLGDCLTPLRAVSLCQHPSKQLLSVWQPIEVSFVNRLSVKILDATGEPSPLTPAALDSVRNFGRDFGQNFIRDFGRGFVQDFMRQYAENFESDFVYFLKYDIGSDFVQKSIRDFGRYFGRDFIRDFIRDFGRDIGRDFIRDFIRDFGRDFIRDIGRGDWSELGIDPNSPHIEADMGDALAEPTRLETFLDQPAVWTLLANGGLLPQVVPGGAPSVHDRLYNPLAFLLWVYSWMLQSVLHHVLDVWRAIVDLRPSKYEEAGQRWLHLNPIAVHLIAWSWDEYAAAYQRQRGRLRGSAGALCLLHAAYACLMTGVECSTSTWQSLLTQRDPADIWVQTAWHVYEICNARDREKHMDALRKLLAQPNSVAQELITLARLDTWGLAPTLAPASPLPVDSIKPAVVPTAPSAAVTAHSVVAASVPTAPPGVTKTVPATAVAVTVAAATVLPTSSDSKMAPTTSSAPLLSWLHLSDIHVGQGNAAHRWNQKQVMDDLLLDLSRLHELSAPRPEVIFVTGDIAFKGDDAEYAQSRVWLQQVLYILGLPPERLFLVPGNHDVNRNVDLADRDIKRLIASLRGGHEPIDAALDGGADQVKLSSRMAEFLRFAQDFAPWRGRSHMAEPALRLWWQHRCKADSGQALRIIGLNTAFLAADDHDKGNLRLGQRQLAECFANPDSDELVIVLSHHPCNEGWLHDQENVSRRVGTKAQLHLFGHIHGQELEQSMRGSGHSHLRVCAGAVHPGQGEALPPSGHGYNLAGLFPVAGDTEGRVELRIWPRRYSPNNQEFRDDVDNLPRGNRYASLPLNNFRSHVRR